MLTSKDIILTGLGRVAACTAALLLVASACSYRSEVITEDVNLDTFDFERVDIDGPEVHGADAQGGDTGSPLEDAGGADACELMTVFLDGDGDGYGTGEGVERCTVGEGHATQGGDCDDGDPARNPGEPEACDGKDNNCNGIIDDGVGCDCSEGQASPCGATETGECAFGTMQCVDGSWGPCVGEIAPTVELCDGLDNDCDGQADETCDCVDGDTQPCGTNTGECAAGLLTCTDGLWSTCAGEVAAKEETCDGLDNDCDGQVDEGCECAHGDTEPCGTNTGLCQKGTSTCTAGAWGPCVGEIAGTPEVCDGQDNDCDGAADEGVKSTFYPDDDEDGYGAESGSNQACSAPQGYVASNTDCDDGDGAVHPGAAELCDSIDNDCDGATNEGSACEGCVEGDNGTGMLCLVDTIPLPTEVPMGVAWDETEGDLYVVTLGDEEMYRVTEAGAVETIPAILGLATDVTFDGTHLRVAAVEIFGTGMIHQVTTSGAIINTNSVKPNENPLGITKMWGGYRVLTNSAISEASFTYYTYDGGASLTNPIEYSCGDVQTCTPGGMAKIGDYLWHTENGGAIVRRKFVFNLLDRFPTADLWDGMPTGIVGTDQWFWVTALSPGRLMKLVYVED